MNGILLAILLTSAPPSFEAATLDGRTVVGPIAELTRERLTIDAKTGRVSIAAATLLTVSAAPPPKPVADALGVVVELADGSVVRGRQFTAHGKEAKIILAEGGESVSFPTSAVHTVLCSANEADPLRPEWMRLMAMKTDADLLIVRAGAALDYHKGVLHDVTADTVRFDLDGDVLPVKRSKVYGFAYRHGAAANLPPAVCRITDAAGSLWPARSVTLETKLQWTTPAGLRVSEPLESIARIDFSAGKLVYLSDLKPDSIAWTPYFGDRDVLPAECRGRRDNIMGDDVEPPGDTPYGSPRAVRPI